MTLLAGKKILHRTIELVEEAGEGAEEIMNNISSAGVKRCAPAFATCALHS